MMGSSARKISPLDIPGPSAKIVDGVLILTLPDAQSPVVWQMELGQTKSSALEVREEQDRGFILILKTPRQDVQEIATYAARDAAVRALVTVSQALQNAARLRPAGEGPVSGDQSYQVPALIPAPAGHGKAVRVTLAILAALALLYVFTRPLGGEQAATAPTAGDATGTAAPTGEPLSADDYLNAP